VTDPCTISLDAELEARIRGCDQLPTLPAVAARIVEILNEDDFGLQDIAEVVADDAAVAVKLVSRANNVAYRRGESVDHVSQAVMRLGLQPTVMTALSFSLAETLQSCANGGFDYEAHFRRSVLSAALSRCVAQHLKLATTEACFLAALVQDIGMLVLDRTHPELYASLKDPANQHAYAISLEQEQLGVTHAEVGAWLLQEWKFPNEIVSAVLESHDPRYTSAERADERWCVTLSGPMADAMIVDSEMTLVRALSFVNNLLAARKSDLKGIETRLAEAITETEEVIDTRLVPNVHKLLDTSKQLMFDRMLEHAEPEHEKIAQLEERLSSLEEKSNRDPLTGLTNRACFDEQLDKAVAEARDSGAALSLLFIDADHFKQVNDTHGHLAGDEVLKSLAATLRDAVRATDVVARYGGEEFVVILPTLAENDAQGFADRVIERFRSLAIDVGETTLSVTVSIGLATLDPRAGIATSRQLILAADQAMYFAKQSGRDRSAAASTLPAIRMAS